MDIGFERIQPIPQYPQGINSALLKNYKWESRANVVLDFKKNLKESLRKIQFGRCCFCRRHLYDDYATHLEHFVDKDSYPQYSFEIRNLALACGTCNINKNGYFSTWNKRYKFFNRNFVGPQFPHCAVLSSQLNPNNNFPQFSSAFSWVNPYVHNYSEHIQIIKGWVFEPRTVRGRRTVRGLKLNNLVLIERRALSERLEMRGGMLSMLVGAIATTNEHRAIDVAAAVVGVIKRRRKMANHKP